jgi:hypothetical protein
MKFDNIMYTVYRQCHEFCAELEYEYVEEGADSGSQLATNIRDIKNEFLANKAQKKQSTKGPDKTPMKTKPENLKTEPSLPDKGQVDPRLTVKASQKLPTDRLKIDPAQAVGQGQKDKPESGQGQNDKPESGQGTIDKPGSGQALEAKMEAGKGNNDKPEKDKTAAEEASKRRGARPQHPRKVARVPFGAKLAVTRVRRPVKLPSVKKTTNKAGLTRYFLTKEL